MRAVFYILITLLLLWLGGDRLIHLIPAAEEPVSAALAARIKEPVQRPTSRLPIQYRSAKLYFVAEFEVTARVLSRRDYRLETLGVMIPVDFAMGWGPMAAVGMSDRWKITQHDRHDYFYFPPDMTREEAVDQANHFSNMHLLPANDAVKDQLLMVRKNQFVTLKGALVNYEGKMFQGLNSSKIRTDYGDGACEIIYVESVQLH